MLTGKLEYRFPIANASRNQVDRLVSGIGRPSDNSAQQFAWLAIHSHQSRSFHEPYFGSIHSVDVLRMKRVALKYD